MRKMRKVRFLVCVMCAALVLGGLTGCGNVSNDTAQKDGQKNTALVNALRKSKEADSVDMDLHLKSTFKVKSDWEWANMEEASSTDFNGKISWFRTPFHVKSNVKVVMDTMQEGENRRTTSIMEAYASKENDKYVVYDRTVQDEDKSVAGAWQKSEGEDSGVLYDSMSFLCISADDLDDDASRYTRLDDVEDHGTTYQAYKYIMTPEEALKWVRKLYRIEEDDDMADVMDQVMAGAAEKLESTEMTVLVDPEQEEIYQWSWNIGKVMEAYMNAVLNKMNEEWWSDDDTCDDEDDDEYEDLDEASDDEEEDEDEEDDRDEQKNASSESDDMNLGLQLTDCSMNYTLTFSNWNAASEFEIPEEVIKEADNKKPKQEKESEDE